MTSKTHNDFNRLNELLEKIDNGEKEVKYLKKHYNHPCFDNFLCFLVDILFPILTNIGEHNKIAWKVVSKGISFYVSKDLPGDGRFMSIDFLKNNIIQYDLFKGNGEIQSKLVETSDDNHCQMKVGLKIDLEIISIIKQSYQYKVTHLKNKGSM